MITVQPCDWRAYVHNWRVTGVTICCPSCGHEGLLKHNIDADGRIRPSLVCGRKPCRATNDVILAGWRFGKVNLG